MDEPFVSCLMLTYNRLKPLKIAINNFIDQTHPNKELIVINSGDEQYMKKVDEFIQSVGGFDINDIHHYKVQPLSIGELRNIGLNHCMGEYVIVFDDDDIHHPQRIEKQLDVCINSNIDGTLLRNFTAVYKNKIFGKKRHKCTMLPGLEGTLLFRKGDVRYPDMDQGEDTGFLELLKDAGYHIAIIDEPYDMYEYNFYGKNTVSKDHFKEMIELNKPLRS